MRQSKRWGTMLAMVLVSLPAFSYATGVFDKKKGLDPDKKDNVPTGWAAYVQLGTSGSLASNSSVIGQTDGLSLTFGLTTAGGVSFACGPHDWRSKLALTLLFSRTPVITERLIKATDELALDSTYYLRLLKWVGPFVRAGLQTNLLPNWNVQASSVTFRKKLEDGTTQDVVASVLDLSSAFQPLTLKQSIGAFFRPYRKKTLELEIRIGLGAHEVFATGAFALDDDSKTPEIEVTELHSYNQLGGEFGLYIRGSHYKGKLRYDLHSEILIPMVADRKDSETRSLVELTNFSFGAKISFKLLAWLSLDYQFKAILQPQLLDEWQVQNTLLLTIGYGFKTRNLRKKKKNKKKK